MAIYITDVDMPSNCLTCPFTEKDDRMGTICYFTNIVALNIGRQVDCPLVYIPEPHGRLIDADWFFNTFTELANYDTEDNAPTVIGGSE